MANLPSFIFKMCMGVLLYVCVYVHVCFVAQRPDNGIDGCDVRL